MNSESITNEFLALQEEKRKLISHLEQNIVWPSREEMLIGGVLNDPAMKIKHWDYFNTMYRLREIKSRINFLDGMTY